MWAALAEMGRELAWEAARQRRRSLEVLGHRGNLRSASFVRLANYESAVPRELRVTETAGTALQPTATPSTATPSTATQPTATTSPATVAADEAAVSGLLTVLRMSRVMERVDSGVSPQQYRMLKLIGAGGERSAKLAEKLAVAKPTLTSTADSLVAAGLACPASRAR